MATFFKKSSSQPQNPTTPSSYWLGRGLVLIDYGNGIIWDKNKGNHGDITTVGTPKRQVDRYGVGTGFGTTKGTGTTDRKDIAVIQKSSTYRSIVSFQYTVGLGGGNLGRIFQPLGTSAVDIGDESLYLGSSGIMFYYNRIASGNNGTWRIDGTLTLNAWSCFGISHNQTATGFTPNIYLNGVKQTTYVQSASTGTYSTTTYTMSRGNRSSDGIRNFDGILGPLFMFEGFLTDSEHNFLAQNPWNIFDSPSFEVLSSAGGNTTTNQTITGKAAIQATSNKTETGVARIQVTTTKTETGVSRIQIITNKTETGLARIQKVVNQTITGVANIVSATGTTTQNISGVSRIQATTVQTETGITRIQKSVDKTIDGVSRIQITTTQNETGIARITAITTKTEIGLSRIQVTTNRTITGVARISGGGTTTTPLTQYSVEVGAGISQSLSPVGNMLEIEIVTTTPTDSPVNGKGVVFMVSGGVITIYVWSGSAWIAK